jgi:hypothetical protein
VPIHLAGYESVLDFVGRIFAVPHWPDLGVPQGTLQRFARRCHIVMLWNRSAPLAPFIATAEALGDPPAPLAIVTRDLRVRENATALGYFVE